jgi:hypothetical protein
MDVQCSSKATLKGLLAILYVVDYGILLQHYGWTRERRTGDFVYFRDTFEGLSEFETHLGVDKSRVGG